MCTLRLARAASGDPAPAGERVAPVWDRFILDFEDGGRLVLRGQDLRGQDLRGRDLTGADLTGALFLTRTQVGGALGSSATRLPPTLERPAHWA